MCGRISLGKFPLDIEDFYQAPFAADMLEAYNPLPLYNIAPTAYMPVLTAEEPRNLRWMRWGLVPHWAKDIRDGNNLFNARIEGIKDKPAFKNPIRMRRCLIPADAFYEWRKTSLGHIPHRVSVPDDRLFSFAGIWDTWEDEESGRVVNSFTIINQKADDQMARLHDRMPAILLPEQHEQWLDTKEPIDRVLGLVRPLPEGMLRFYSVSMKINKSGENLPEFTQEVKYQIPVQGKLF